MAVTLARCADSEPDRQFATDNVPAAVTPSPSPWPTPRTEGNGVPAASPADPLTLLTTRGAPSYVYFKWGDDLWGLDPAGADPWQLFAPPSDVAIVGVAASPSGDAVAALLAHSGNGTARVDVLILDRLGETIGRIENVDNALPAFDSGEVRAESISWSPQGGVLLLGFSPGLLVSVAVDGTTEPEVVVNVDQLSSPSEAAWSPTGQSIAFLTTPPEEQGASLWVANVEGTPTAPRPVLSNITDDQTVSELAWTPNGRALLFVENAMAGGLATGGDLWLITPDGQDRKLIAGAGSAVPVGQIASVRPSPDGRAVAYTIEVPSDTATRFHSLWIRDLATGRVSLRIDVPDDERVVMLWWTAQGVLFRTVAAEAAEDTSSTADLSLYLVEPDGTTTSFLNRDASATPIAAGTPVPAATPRASPVIP